MSEHVRWAAGVIAWSLFWAAVAIGVIAGIAEYRVLFRLLGIN